MLLSPLIGWTPPEFPLVKRGGEISPPTIKRQWQESCDPHDKGYVQHRPEKGGGGELRNVE